MSVGTTMRRAICVVCLALVAGLVFALPAYAQKTDPYEYTVRVFGGNNGTYSGADPYVTTVKAGEVFTLRTGDVTLDNGSKYYAKGFRVSGQDDLCSAAYTVNEDTDFVVAYGVKGDMVSYTVRFVEYQTNRALTADNGATSVTYYGKVGDKPVVPFEYVDGYRPRYRNITGTLGPEGTNNWVLEYIRLTAEQTQNQNQNANAGGNAAGGGAAAGGAAAGGAAAGGAAAGGAAAGGAAAGGAAAGAAEGGANAEGGQAANPATPATPATPPATEEIGDVDNPLASGNEGLEEGEKTPGPAEEPSEQSESTGIPVAAIYAVAALLVAAVAAGAIVLRRRNS